MIDQLVQVFGSLLILTAFLLLQARKTSSHARIYLIMNLVGSLILAINAVIVQQWGFLLLQVAWAIVSLISLVKILKMSPVSAPKSSV